MRAKIPFFVVFVCFHFGTVRAQQTLQPVEVRAYTLDGSTAIIPQFMTGSFELQSCGLPGVNCPEQSSVDSTYLVNMTKDQVCSKLRKSQPDNCTMKNFPNAPGLPNALGIHWSGNGCGADALSTAEATLFLETFGNKFSGDLNKPVAGNPAIDFTASCNRHDACYTSPNRRGLCDALLGMDLNKVCTLVTSDDEEVCDSFAGEYEDGVAKKGLPAYNSDQTQLHCSEWGNAMKQNGC